MTDLNKDDYMSKVQSALCDLLMKTDLFDSYEMDAPWDNFTLSDDAIEGSKQLKIYEGVNFTEHTAIKKGHIFRFVRETYTSGDDDLNKKINQEYFARKVVQVEEDGENICIVDFEPELATDFFAGGSLNTIHFLGTKEVYEDLPQMYISESKNSVVFFTTPRGFFTPVLFLECYESNSERGDQQGLWRADIIIRIMVLFDQSGSLDFTERNTNKKESRQFLSYLQKWLFKLDSNRSDFPKILSDNKNYPDLFIPDFVGMEIVKSSEGSMYNFALEERQTEQYFDGDYTSEQSETVDFIRGGLVLLLASSVTLKMKLPTL